MHSFQEHVNDHQLLFCRQVAQRCSNIILVEDIASLRDVLVRYDAIAQACAATASSHNTAFIQGFQEVIDTLFLQEVPAGNSGHS